MPKTLALITSLTLLSFLLNLPSAIAQQTDAPKSESRTLPVDTEVVTKHSVKINGKKVTYTATVGTQPVWDEEGSPIASLFYTYYERQDVDMREARPIVYSFNGGPGSASVWMHIAYTGPKVLNLSDEGYPIQPYGVQDNPYSILDVADIVFINPVNTGYSRVLPNEDGEMPSRDKQKESFFGVNADIKYLAEWMNTFTSRKNRWQSPKYLIGESYGTTRVSGLALELQNSQWMYLNGVILVSPTDIGLDRDGPVKQANQLPYFAAAAWYHGVLPQELQEKDLVEMLPEVEAFALDNYLPALAKGAMLSGDAREKMAERIAYYSGISKQSVLDNNLAPSASFFWKELLREQNRTIGRLDSRYLGIDEKRSGDRPDYNAELTSWLHSFTPAINYYLREELKFVTDIKYNMFGPVRPWDRSDNNSGRQLRQAMAQNPYLNVLIQSGYFDGATNYFDAKYNMWHLDPSAQMIDRIEFKGYESGHMMYLRRVDLKNANDDIREFILRSDSNGKPAEYQLSK